MYNISSVIEIFNLCDTEVVINISSVVKRYLIFVTQKLLYV